MFNYRSDFDGHREAAITFYLYLDTSEMNDVRLVRGCASLAESKHLGVSGRNKNLKNLCFRFPSSQAHRLDWEASSLCSTKIIRKQPPASSWYSINA